MLVFFVCVFVEFMPWKLPFLCYDSNSSREFSTSLCVYLVYISIYNMCQIISMEGICACFYVCVHA